MIDSIMKELGHILPFKKADEAASPLPQVVLTPIEERLIFRADGRDYLTDILFRCDAYGKDMEQTRELFSRARTLITKDKPFMRTRKGFARARCKVADRIQTNTVFVAHGDRDGFKPLSGLEGDTVTSDRKRAV